VSDLSEFDHPVEAEAANAAPFTVDNDAKAEWALRKLNAIRAKQNEFRDIARLEIERVNFWLTTQEDKYKQEASYFESLLITYAMLERERNDRKTIDLPHGKIKSRSVGEKIEIQNETEFLDWARTNAPDLVRVKESVNLKALGDLPRQGELIVSVDGEIIPALKVLPASVNFNIETESER
jgi:hypothetical protein